MGGVWTGHGTKGRQAGCMESAASESRIICKHQVTPLEKDLTVGVQLTIVYIGRGVILSRMQSAAGAGG